MKQVAKIKNKLFVALSLVLCVVICIGMLATGNVTNVSASTGFTVAAPTFGTTENPIKSYNITTGLGDYVIPETNGVNVSFTNETDSLVYSKDIDISTYNGDKPLIWFYVEPLGDRNVNFYIDVVETANPDNYFSVRFSSKDIGSTWDSSISAKSSNEYEVYSAYFFGSTTQMRANYIWIGQRKYSNITISDGDTAKGTGRNCDYAPLHFTYNQSNQQILTTLIDREYNATNLKLVTDLDDTTSVVDYYLSDYTTAAPSEHYQQHRGLVNEAWNGFETDNVTIKMRVEAIPFRDVDVVDADHPVNVYITSIGNEAVDASKLAFKAPGTPVAVTYELNGGSNATENPAEIVSDQTITLKDATKTGYEFLGWYTTATFEEGTKVTTIPTDAAEVTLYAKFGEIVDNGGDTGDGNNGSGDTSTGDNGSGNTSTGDTSETGGCGSSIAVGSIALAMTIALAAGAVLVVLKKREN